MDSIRLTRRIRILLILFAAGLALSGLTAFPLTWETRLLNAWFGHGTTVGAHWPALAR